MHLKSLYLKTFRNYREESFIFSEGINAIIGENAQGKTNLLEAIHVLITGRSFRTSLFSDLPQFGHTSFYLEACFEKTGISHSLKMFYQDGERKIMLNHTPIPTLSSLYGILLGVILSPEDRILINGPPAKRRQLLDVQIAQVTPVYIHHIRRYEKALKQRNTLLKQKRTESIEVWEEQMALSGSYLAREREKAVKELEKQVQKIGQTLSTDKEKISMKYHSAFSCPKNFQKKLAKSRKKELLLGYTLIGPHKEDIGIFLNNSPAAAFASEGQKRTIITSLRLAQWQILKQRTSELPLFCIDDVGIFLDKKREEKLFSAFPDLGQIFITSPQKLPKGPCFHTFFIAKGQVQKEPHGIHLKDGDLCLQNTSPRQHL